MCHITDHCWGAISRTICFSSKWIKGQYLPAFFLEFYIYNLLLPGKFYVNNDYAAPKKQAQACDV